MGLLELAYLLVLSVAAVEATGMVAVGEVTGIAVAAGVIGKVAVLGVIGVAAEVEVECHISKIVIPFDEEVAQETVGATEDLIEIGRRIESVTAL